MVEHAFKNRGKELAEPIPYSFYHIRDILKAETEGI